MPWSDLGDGEARWYSGTGVYTVEFDLKTLPQGADAILDLGDVAAMAAVKINESPELFSWIAPHHISVTPYLHAGRNELQITVTNTWRNRLSYDAGLPEAQRKTWTISGPGPASRPEPAGLIGPVVLHIGQRMIKP